MTMLRGAVNFTVSMMLLAFSMQAHCAEPGQLPIGREDAVLTLRAAAADGSAATQRMLATLLENGTQREQLEALDWYRLASQRGDVRAYERYRRLDDRLARLLPQRATGKQTQDPENTPSGYHCHFIGMGLKWCHAGADRTAF